MQSGGGGKKPNLPPHSAPQDEQREEGPWGTAPSTAQVLPPPSPPLPEPPGACPRARHPPCQPSQDPVALLRAPAAPCPDPAAFPAGSPYLLLRRPCPGPERLPRARARLQQRPGGKLEDENVRGRRDLSPRNCLAQFVLYKGGEYPRERSAHAFPRSWKSVTLCIGRIIFVGIFFPPFSIFFFFLLFTLLKALPDRLGSCQLWLAH